MITFSGFNYMGCIQGSFANGRPHFGWVNLVASNWPNNGVPFTAEECYQLATAKGYTLFGLNDYRCFGANELPVDVSTSVSCNGQLGRGWSIGMFEVTK